MSLHAQLRPLLAQYVGATGRGNMILANHTMVRIIETLAAAIPERPVLPPAPEPEPPDPSLEPDAIWDQPRVEPPKRRVRRTVRTRRRKTT
jgi:hypothetical protein